MNAVIKYTDCSIICGYRNEKEQEKVYQKGYSRVQFPNSKHNKQPSEAVDVVLYPIRWNNLGDFKKLAKIIKRIAKEKDIKLVWGGDWSWTDCAHWELEEDK